MQRVTKLQGLILVYASAPPDSLLWPYSAATLRKRFCSLLEGVSLETKRVGGRRPFDLGSLRPGGATHLLVATEDSELVRRCGRWVMTNASCYLQKVLYTLYHLCGEAGPCDTRQDLAAGWKFHSTAH